jgi:hypothetical protein
MDNKIMTLKKKIFSMITISADLNCQFYGKIFCGHILWTVVFLQEFPDGLGVAPDGIGFPLMIGSAGVGLVQLGRLVVVEAGDEAGDAEWAPAVGLGVPLLQ